MKNSVSLLLSLIVLCLCTATISYADYFSVDANKPGLDYFSYSDPNGSYLISFFPTCNGKQAGNYGVYQRIITNAYAT